MRNLMTAAVILPTMAGSMMACTTTASTEQPAPPLAANCIDSGAAMYLGKTATQDLGADILRTTQAGTFQWVPADSAVTMDYRPDRVRVSYDQDMKITSVRCG